MFAGVQAPVDAASIRGDQPAMASQATAQPRLNRRLLPAGLDTAEMLRLFEQMTLLRRFELAAGVACRKGDTPGFLHLYIGEEAVATGVCPHLTPSDWIAPTHRGHGHALAKGMNPNVLMAELYGKASGSVGGRGGTMHLYERSIGLFGTNGVVASGAPQALGAAISAKYPGTRAGAGAVFGVRPRRRDRLAGHRNRAGAEAPQAKHRRPGGRRRGVRRRPRPAGPGHGNRQRPPPHEPPPGRAAAAKPKKITRRRLRRRRSRKN